MSLLDRDCSLDLHEAIQLLELLFFTFENAQEPDDWLKMREPIGSGIYAVQQVIQDAMRRVEGAPVGNRAANANGMH